MASTAWEAQQDIDVDNGNGLDGGVLEPAGDLVMFVDTHNTAHVPLPHGERTFLNWTVCGQRPDGMAGLYDLLDTLAAPWSLLTDRQYRAWPPWPCQTCVSRAQGGDDSDAGGTE